MDRKRTVHFNAPGFKSQEVEVAPDIDPVQSKRKELIVEEDLSLDSNIHELDIGTRSRNKAFQDRLDDIWGTTSTWEAKLRTEAKEAVETILNMKEEYDNHINSFRDSIFNQINEIFDHIDNNIIPAEVRRVDEIEKNLEIFIKEKVPQTIEKQSGEVSRQLRRSYETFDIEKKKEYKRESKLVQRASKHIQKSAQRFLDEQAFLSSSFFLLEDDVIEYERRAARSHLAQNDMAVSQSHDLEIISEGESSTRKDEDVIVLDTVIETQQILQQMVLMHFGTKAEDMEFPDTEKLNERMTHLAEKQKAKSNS